jgi:hypothetical protein
MQKRPYQAGMFHTSKSAIQITADAINVTGGPKMSLAQKLRDEIISFQQSQREIMRWKLIAVGAVAATALGLASNNAEMAIIISCIVPPIALYCDAVYRDGDLRIAMLATFLETQSEFLRQYEQHVRAFTGWHRIGWGATLGSSLFIASAIGLMGVIYCVAIDDALNVGIVALAVGAGGAVGAWRLDHYYTDLFNKIGSPAPPASTNQS